MVKSLRLRLQIWYAAVLVIVIGGFAAVLYIQVDRDRMRAIDARLQSAVTYLQATLRGIPPEPMPPGGPRGGPREGDRFHGPPPPQDRPFPEPPPPEDGFFGEGPRGGPRPRPPHHDRSRPPAERLQQLVELPGSLLDQQGPGPKETPYFIIWRPGGKVLAASADAPATTPPPDEQGRVDHPGPGNPPGFRWAADERREVLAFGPRGTLILVGKPVGRELADLRWLAWRLAASGAVVLVAGLAGGWLISRGITRTHRGDRRHRLGDLRPQPGPPHRDHGHRPGACRPGHDSQQHVCPAGSLVRAPVALHVRCIARVAHAAGRHSFARRAGAVQAAVR